MAIKRRIRSAKELINAKQSKNIGGFLSKLEHSDVADVPDIMDVLDVPDVLDVAYVLDVPDVVDVPGVADGPDIVHVPDVAKVSKWLHCESGSGKRKTARRRMEEGKSIKRRTSRGLR